MTGTHLLATAFAIARFRRGGTWGEVAEKTAWGTGNTLYGVAIVSPHEPTPVYVYVTNLLQLPVGSQNAKDCDKSRTIGFQNSSDGYQQF